MPIRVTKENGHTKIVGSQTYPNGMTMTFHGPGDRMPGRPVLLDIRHARSWLAAKRIQADTREG